MRETELAWLAGFLEGEGTIAVYPVGKGLRWFYPRIHINNSDKRLLERCREIITKYWGTRATVREWAQPSENRGSIKGTNFKQMYQLTFVGRWVYDALKALLPYMVGGKKDRVKEMLKKSKVVGYKL